MNRDNQKAEIEASLRRVEDALRRRDPDTLAGRMGTQHPTEPSIKTKKVKAANKALG